MSRRASQGFTLFELLITLMIIGLGWFALLPNLDLANTDQGQDKGVGRVNAFMQRVRNEAVGSYSHQRIIVALGEGYLEWRDEKCPLPEPVSHFQVNGVTPLESKTPFRVYRDGYMDGVRIVLVSGEVMESDVLSARF